VQCAALLAALGAVALLLWVPLYTEHSFTGGPGGVESTTTSRTLIEANGTGVLYVLAVPVLLTAAPLLAGKRWGGVAAAVSACLLAVGVFLAILTIGLFFVPALALAIVAAVWREPEPWDAEHRH
jgi:hypothetical protein